MARPDTGSKTNSASDKQPPGSYTIKQFCDAFNYSVAFFYKMKADPATYGEPPEEMIVGRRRYISYEAATKWRKQREAAAKRAQKAEMASKRSSKKATATTATVQE